MSPFGILHTSTYAASSLAHRLEESRRTEADADADSLNHDSRKNTLSSTSKVRFHPKHHSVDTGPESSSSAPLFAGFVSYHRNTSGQGLGKFRGRSGRSPLPAAAPSAMVRIADVFAKPLKSHRSQRGRPSALFKQGPVARTLPALDVPVALPLEHALLTGHCHCCGHSLAACVGDGQRIIRPLRGHECPRRPCQ
jgi:hypothetical protein